MLPSGQKIEGHIWAKTALPSGAVTARFSDESRCPRESGTLVSTGAPKGGGPAGAFTRIAIPERTDCGDAGDRTTGVAGSIEESDTAAPPSSDWRKKARRLNLLIFLWLTFQFECALVQPEFKPGRGTARFYPPLLW